MYQYKLLYNQPGVILHLGKNPLGPLVQVKTVLHSKCGPNLCESHPQMWHQLAVIASLQIPNQNKVWQDPDLKFG